MARTPQQIGRASRSKGKRFERECRAVMSELTGWPDWKRTQRGDKQHRGDLVPCEPDGRELTAITCPQLPNYRTFYVECRVRATLSKPKMARWWDDTKMQARKSQAAAVLLCKQDRGPILAFCSWIQSEEDHLIAAVI